MLSTVGSSFDFNVSSQGVKEHSCITLTVNDILYNKKAYGGPQQYIPTRAVYVRSVQRSLKEWSLFMGGRAVEI